jgi:excreted virulence factor EspC (type VII ESX diderm)
MSGELSVEAAAVHRHAAGVDEVADAVRLAASAVHDVTMDSQAYGQLCQFLPGLLTPLFGLARAAMTRSAGSLGETATKLRTTAEQMRDTDTAAARRVNRSMPELPL